GLLWNNGHYSCAYDSLFTYFLEMLRNNDGFWITGLSEGNVFMAVWCFVILSYPDQPEIGRDMTRHLLHEANPEKFPNSPTLMRIPDLLQAIADSTSYGIHRICCEICGYMSGQEMPCFSQFQEVGTSS
ncbi:hypothetical protein C8R45DRAFT_817080, partial [Mycena sanguinolenta]